MPFGQKINNRDKYDYINFEFIFFPNKKIEDIYFARKKSILEKLKEILVRSKRKTLVLESKYRTLKSLKIFNEMTCNELKFLDVFRINAEEIKNFIEKSI